jgi:hypothetical protein
MAPRHIPPRLKVSAYPPPPFNNQLLGPIYYSHTYHSHIRILPTTVIYGSYLERQLWPKVFSAMSVASLHFVVPKLATFDPLGLKKTHFIASNVLSTWPEKRIL